MSEPVVVQKRPKGRPKKHIVSQFEMKGIVTEHSNPDTVVEFIYSGITILKTLSVLNKHYKAPDVSLIFYDDTFVIKARDHNNRALVCATFDCNLVNLYYCKTPVCVSFPQIALEQVLGSINTNTSNISFSISNINNMQMCIEIFGSEYNNKRRRIINFDLNEVPDLGSLNDYMDDYKLWFQFSSMHFKSEIKMLSANSDIMTIQKTGTSPLKILGISSSTINDEDIYEDENKLKLVSRLGPEESINVSVVLVHIEPLSKVNFATHVELFVRPDDDLVLKIKSSTDAS
mgnify:CR=1 FL=1